MAARYLIDRIIRVLRQERARQAAAAYCCQACGEAHMGLKHARMEALDHAIEAVELDMGLLVERMWAHRKSQKGGGHR